jgi:ADP-heptose:LPS heptosyltransferase
MNTLQNILYNFRHYLTKLGFKENNSPVPNLDLKLSASELAEKKTLYGIVQNDKTICIFTFATADKCYPESWWALYDRLKAEYQTIILLKYYPLKMYLK